jgi:hypothetical protein
LLYADFWFGFLFVLEDGGNISLLKHQLIFAGLYGTIFQKVGNFTVIAVRTSNPTWNNLSVPHLGSYDNGFLFVFFVVILAIPYF